MPVIPDSKVGKIEFCEGHVPTWTTNATAIGTTTTAVTALGTLTTAARAALLAQQTAQSASKDATVNLNIAVEAMNSAAADIIKQVRAKAATAGDGVYSLASIPVPATPSPVGPPGTPSNFTVSLNADGSLNLAWKCTNPAGGTIYQVYRRVGAEDSFTYLGGVGAKKFVDDTLPAGSSAVTYQIQAVRSTAVGAWAQFNVNFGVGGSGGAVTAFVTESAPPPQAKLAA